MKPRQSFEVLGYETKYDFENKDFLVIAEDQRKQSAVKFAKNEIKYGDWYAVKYQSSDGEEMEILYSNQIN